MRSKPTDFLKELRQKLIIYQLFIKPLAQDLDLSEVVLAEWKEVNLVCFVVDQFFALGGEFIESVHLEFSQEGAFLDAFQTVSLALFGNLVAGFVIRNIVKNPDKNGHLNSPDGIFQQLSYSQGFGNCF